jgi:hypothetical protein
MKCPLISSQCGARNCVAPDCAFTNKNGKCLIKQALQCYIREHTVIQTAMSQTEPVQLRPPVLTDAGRVLALELMRTRDIPPRGK